MIAFKLRLVLSVLGERNSLRKTCSPPLRDSGGNCLDEWQTCRAGLPQPATGGATLAQTSQRPPQCPPRQATAAKQLPVSTHLISRLPSSATPRLHLAAGAVRGRGAGRESHSTAAYPDLAGFGGAPLPSITGPQACTPFNPRCGSEGLPAESAVGGEKPKTVGT